MSVADNLNAVKNTLPSHVTLVAVSKTHPNNAIMDAYQCGQRQFGENKVQELVSKYEALPKDIEWHMIGHLQSNKVKYIVPFVALIHGVDSIKLLQCIDKEARKVGRVVDCLLQVHIAMESTKFGFGIDELPSLLTSELITSLGSVRIRGLMGMATFTDDDMQVKHEFSRLKKVFDSLKQGLFSCTNSFDLISMGMSDDYLFAVSEGSNMVRVGSSIFGERDYR
jgi:PLP dependent protein